MNTTENERVNGHALAEAHPSGPSRVFARAVVYTGIGMAYGDLIDITIHVTATTLLTIALALVLPAEIAIGPALLAVSLWRGYTLARRSERERNRSRGERR